MLDNPDNLWYNKEKKEKSLNNYAPLLPSIIRKDDDLKILVLLTKDEDNVWDIKENIKEFMEKV